MENCVFPFYCNDRRISLLPVSLWFPRKFLLLSLSKLENTPSQAFLLPSITVVHRITRFRNWTSIQLTTLGYSNPIKYAFKTKNYSVNNLIFNERIEKKRFLRAEKGGGHFSKKFLKNIECVKYF